MLGQPTASVLTAELQGTMRIAATEVVRAAGPATQVAAVDAVRRLGLDVYDLGSLDHDLANLDPATLEPHLAYLSGALSLQGREQLLSTLVVVARSGGADAEGQARPVLERIGHGLAMSPAHVAGVLSGAPRRRRRPRRGHRRRRRRAPPTAPADRSPTCATESLAHGSGRRRLRHAPTTPACPSDSDHVAAGTYDPAHDPRRRAARFVRPLRPRVLAATPRLPRRGVQGAARRAAAAVLQGVGLPRLAVPRRARVLRAHPPRGRVARQPQPAAVLQRPGLEHRRHAPGDERVLRVDDQHGRPEALPPALDRLQGLHPEGDQQGRGVRQDEGGDDRRRAAGALPRRRVRLRRGDRRSPAAADHLRDDGHPARRRAAGLRLDERHPRRRRPRVRHVDRRPDGRGDGHVLLRPGARRVAPRPTRPTT